MQNHQKNILLLLFMLFISVTAHADIFDLEIPEPEKTETTGPTIFDNVPVGTNNNPPQHQQSQTNWTAEAELIPSNHVLAKITASKGIVLLHVSTNDSACLRCVASSKNFNQQVSTYKDGLATYWRTNVKQYNSVLKVDFALKFEIKSLPAVILFKDGEMLKRWEGLGMNSDVHRTLYVEARKAVPRHKRFGVLFHPLAPANSAPAGIKEIENETALYQYIDQLSKKTKPTPNELKGLSKENQRQLVWDRLPQVVVSYSSYDKNCGPCIKMNHVFNQFANSHKGHFHFIRIMPKTWSESTKFKKTFLITHMPTTLLFHGNSLVNMVEGLHTPNTLPFTLLYDTPAETGDEWYKASNEKVTLSKQTNVQYSRAIKYIPVTVNSALLWKNIQQSQGLLIVTIHNQIHPIYLPGYAKILHQKYNRHINFIHTIDILGEVRNSKLGMLYDLHGAPIILLFKDGKLVRKFSLDMDERTLTIGGIESDNEAQKAIAIQMEHALFD